MSARCDVTAEPHVDRVVPVPKRSEYCDSRPPLRIQHGKPLLARNWTERTDVGQHGSQSGYQTPKHENGSAPEIAFCGLLSPFEMTFGAKGDTNGACRIPKQKSLQPGSTCRIASPGAHRAGKTPRPVSADPDNLPFQPCSPRADFDRWPSTEYDYA